MRWHTVHTVHTACASPLTKPMQPQIMAPTCHECNHETISAPGSHAMRQRHRVASNECYTGAHAADVHVFIDFVRFRRWNATQFVCLFGTRRSRVGRAIDSRYENALLIAANWTSTASAATPLSLASLNTNRGTRHGQSQFSRIYPANLLYFRQASRESKSSARCTCWHLSSSIGSRHI